MDCAGPFNNFGCHGGLPSQAFEYIKYNGGLETEEAYPYTGKDGVCKFSAENVAVQVLDSVNITLVLNYLISTLNELGFSALCIHSFFCYHDIGVEYPPISLMINFRWKTRMITFSGIFSPNYVFVSSK